MKFLSVPLLLILTSCSLFQSATLSRNIHKESQKVCLSGEGKGRLKVSGRKYVFSYESALESEKAQWLLALDFPMRNLEEFRIDWSNGKDVKLKTTIDDALLSQNKNIDPKALDRFTRGIADLIKEIISLKENKKVESKFKWMINSKELRAVSKNKRIIASFQNPVAESYFGLMSIEYRKTSKKSYKMELVVRNCLENE